MRSKGIICKFDYCFIHQVSVDYLDQQVNEVSLACLVFQVPWDLRVPQDLRVLKESGERSEKGSRVNLGIPEFQVKQRSNYIFLNLVFRCLTTQVFYSFDFFFRSPRTSW